MNINIDEVLGCKARKKIVHFFHNNPTSIDTVRGIVTWTGLNKKQVTKALKELVGAQVLTEYPGRSTVGYAYTNNKKLMDKIRYYFQKGLTKNQTRDI